MPAPSPCTQAQQQSPQANGFVCKSAARGSGVRSAAVALIEYEIDHLRDCCESRAPLVSTGCLEFDAHVRNRPLGAGNPLLHGRGRHQECFRNLLDREPGHDAKCERDLLSRGQSRMPAHEQQTQDVVSIVTLVEALRSQLVAGVRECISVRQRCDEAGSAPGVQGGVAPDHDEPRRGIPGRAFVWPGLQSPQAGFLKSFLSGVQVAEVAQQGCNDPRPGAQNREIDVSGIVHLRQGHWVTLRTDTTQIFPRHCRQAAPQGVLAAQPHPIGRCVMKVMVFVKATQDSEDGVPPDPKLIEAMLKYNEALIAAGILREPILGGLQPTRFAKRVHFSGKNRTVTDGPFAETKEIVAGFWLWEVQSIDEAVEWVKKCPNPMYTDSDIDIRPLYGPEAFDLK
jgi:hypothetical protein